MPKPKHLIGQRCVKNRRLKIKRAQQTPEEKEQRRRKSRIAIQKIRSNETAEERELRLKQERIYRAELRRNETKKQRELRLEKNRQRMAWKKVQQKFIQQQQQYLQDNECFGNGMINQPPLDMPVGLVYYTDQVCTIICSLCDTENQFGEISSLINHLKNLHTATYNEIQSKSEKFEVINCPIIDIKEEFDETEFSEHDQNNVLYAGREYSSNFENILPEDYLHDKNNYTLDFNSLTEATSLQKFPQEVLSNSAPETLSHSYIPIDYITIKTEENAVKYTANEGLLTEHKGQNCTPNLNTTAAISFPNIQQKFAAENKQKNRSNLQNPKSDITIKSEKDGEESSGSQESDSKLFYCNHCAKLFCVAKELLEHVCASAPSATNALCNTETPFRCTFCSATFFTRKELNIHVQQFVGDEQHKLNKFDGLNGTADTQIFEYERDDCNQFFKSSNTLTIHKERHHTPTKPVQCSQCGVSFNPSARLQHHKNVHECAQCIRKAISRQLHMKINQNGSKKAVAKNMANSNNINKKQKTFTASLPKQIVAKNVSVQFQGNTVDTNKDQKLPFECNVGFQNQSSS